MHFKDVVDQIDDPILRDPVGCVERSHARSILAQGRIGNFDHQLGHVGMIAQKLVCGSAHHRHVGFGLAVGIERERCLAAYPKAGAESSLQRRRHPVYRKHVARPLRTHLNHLPVDQHDARLTSQCSGLVHSVIFASRDPCRLRFVRRHSATKVAHGRYRLRAAEVSSRALTLAK